MEKTSGGGFYLQVGPEGVLVAAGVYMPEPEQLLAIRRWMADHHAAYRALLKKASRVPSGKAAPIPPAPLTPIDPAALTRMPKGFAPDHPAGELLRARNWRLQALLPPETALQPSVGTVLTTILGRAAPLVATLNGAIEAGRAASAPARKPLF